MSRQITIELEDESFCWCCQGARALNVSIATYIDQLIQDEMDENDLKGNCENHVWDGQAVHLFGEGGAEKDWEKIGCYRQGGCRFKEGLKNG